MPSNAILVKDNLTLRSTAIKDQKELAKICQNEYRIRTTRLIVLRLNHIHEFNRIVIETLALILSLMVGISMHDGDDREIVQT